MSTNKPLQNMNLCDMLKAAIKHEEEVSELYTHIINPIVYREFGTEKAKLIKDMKAQSIWHKIYLIKTSNELKCR